MTREPVVARTLQAVLRQQRAFRRQVLLAAVIVLIVTVWSAHGTDFNLPKLIVGLPKFADLLRRMLPPDFSVLSGLAWPMIETLQIALVGTTFGVFVAIPLGFLAATNTTPHWSVSAVLRIVL